MTATEIRKQLVVSLSRMSALGRDLSIEAVGSEMLAVLAEIAAQLAELNATLNDSMSNLGDTLSRTNDKLAELYEKPNWLPEDIVRGRR